MSLLIICVRIISVNWMSRIMHTNTNSVSSLNSQNYEQIQVNSHIVESQVNETINDTEQNHEKESNLPVEQSELNGCNGLDSQNDENQLSNGYQTDDEEFIVKFKEESQTVEQPRDILLSFNKVDSKIDLNVACEDISRFCMFDNNMFVFADYLKGKFNIVRLSISQHMLEYNPENELREPFGVCFDGIDKLFIGDFKLRKIIVYDIREHPVKIKEYGDDRIKAIDTINLDR